MKKLTQSRRGFLQTAAFAGAAGLTGTWPGITWSAEGDTLTVRFDADMGSLDPGYYVGGHPPNDVNWCIMPALVHASEESPGWVASPYVESIEVVDSTHIDFTLKKGLMWSGDYGEVTAEDVAYSYDRMKESEWKGDYVAYERVDIKDSHSGTIVLNQPFAPFMNMTLARGTGIILCKAAMEAAAPEQGFAIHWVDDWASHHEPLLSNALLDIGFPWFKPDCASDPETYRCANLKFSDSMFEVLMLLFVDTTRPIAFNSDADLEGKTLCRPAGYSTYIFDQNGRNWLKSGHISLKIGDSPADCLELLAEGEVDAAVLNEFLGRKKIKELGLGDRVRVAEGQPISVDGNHMVVHKSHPQGDALLAVFETGLDRIKADGTYQRIVDEHMTRVWAEF